MKSTGLPAMTPPLLTADLPGVGGRVRVRDEDFEVEEVPSYEPSGSGDHLYLWVEKRGMAPEFFTRTIAQRLGTHPGNIGTAGLKDRHAITRQWVSVPKECELNVGKLDGDGIRVLRPRCKTLAVDVSSGVEASKGIKGAGKIREFVAAVRAADAFASQ